MKTLCNGDATVLTIPQAMSDLTGNISAGQLPSGGVPVSNISATGSASSSTYLRGDGSWQTPSGSGGMTWPSAAGIAVYSGSSTWGTSLTAPASAIVGISDMQTLTNKTLTSPVLTTPALGTPASGTLTNCTFPTLNQNTTGSSGSCTGNSATATTASACSGNSATVTGLVVASGKTHTVNNSITLAGTDSTTMTFPGTSDTVVTLAATQTLTNKTLTSPTLTTPALGTPASGVLTNCSGLPAANVVAGTMASGMTFVAPVLGTPASGTLTNCTFPTLNQNTTGTAGGLTGTPAITVAGITCSSITNSGVSANKRITAHAGTVPTSTSFALSSGWGTSPTLTIVEGTDQACQITIVAKATVGASPTVTYTFKDGTWTQVPIVVCNRTDASAAAAAPGATVTNQWVVTSLSATAVTFTFNGTPVANNTYGLAWIAMGT